MEKNVGGFDKKLRIAVGAAIIAAGVLYNSWWGAIGILPITSALLGWCPPYAIFGINSCKTNNTES